jgi:hypothetical protein
VTGPVAYPEIICHEEAFRTFDARNQRWVAERMQSLVATMLDVPR